MSWVAEEFSRFDLKRLNKRLIAIMEKFSKKPSCSILASSGTWKESMAAYSVLFQ
jgi:hypothetical protein